MKTDNVVLMNMARESLQGNWSMAIGTCVIYFLLVAAIQAIPGFGTVASLILSGPMTLGLTIFSLSISRNKESGFEQLFHGFRMFGPALEAYLLILVYVILWTILLVVPGIIAAISYSMTFFIIADDESIRSVDAMKKSKQMMYGYKLKFFYLGLRFLLLALLCVLTLGIGFLWLMPYIQITFAKFYDDIKDNPISPESI